MNIGLSLLFKATDADLLADLAFQLPASGRPAFSDDPSKGSQKVYDAICDIMPPSEIIVENNCLFVSWYETEYQVDNIQQPFERLGLILIFSHTNENGDPEECDSETQDIVGTYHILSNGSMVRLLPGNVSELIPKSKFKFTCEAETNIGKLIGYFCRLKS